MSNVDVNRCHFSKHPEVLDSSRILRYSQVFLKLFLLRPVTLPVAPP